MKNICENCKYKSEAVAFDYAFNVIARYCKKEKTWVPEYLEGCEDYEPNLHDHNAAP